MVNYLIPYLDPKKNGGEEDPLFSEFTYGDKGQRGKNLKTKVSKGDYLFFHTTIRNKRYITAFYEVEEVLSKEKAKVDNIIMMKYKNPHLLSNETQENETIVFGNSIRSVVLKVPLELNEPLLNECSIPFNPSPNQTKLAALSSRFRNWAELSPIQTDCLLVKMRDLYNQSFLKQKQLSSDEIRQLSESDIEQFLADHPDILGSGLELISRQHQFQDGKRLDLLVKHDEDQQIYIVEIKKYDIGKEVLKQLRGYIDRYEAEEKVKGVKGIIVCKGILPHFEDHILNEAAKEKIQIYQYGWKFSLQEV